MPQSLNYRLGLWAYTTCASGLLVCVIVYILVSKSFAGGNLYKLL